MSGHWHDDEAGLSCSVCTERNALPPYTQKPVTTVGGLRVVGWSSPVPVVDEGPDHIAPEDRCTECAGWSGWTETNRHGDDIDSPCHHCGETGVEP